MTIGYGILLFIIGITLTIVGLFLAYHYGSKEKKKEKLTTVQQSLRDLNKWNITKIKY